VRGETIDSPDLTAIDVGPAVAMPEHSYLRARAVTVATKRVLPRSARMVVYRQAAAGKR